jgi:cell division transport system permease protein
LHVIGAREAFIAGEFQRHFMLLGLKGAAAGGAAAILLFVGGALISRWFGGGPDASQLTALFGHLSLGLAGYGAIIGLVVLVAAVTTLMSRLTVQRTLKAME